MKIALTYAQGRSVMVRLADRWLAEQMHEVRKHTWNKSHLYELPPVAWRRVLDDLRATSYTSGGAKVAGNSLYEAIGRITETVIEFELHPAFHGQGIVGTSAEIVAGFELNGRVTPYPPGRFVLLAPHHYVRYGRTLTTWVEQDWVSAQEPLQREDFHQRFAGEIRLP